MIRNPLTQQATNTLTQRMTTPGIALLFPFLLLLLLATATEAAEPDSAGKVIMVKGNVSAINLTGEQRQLQRRDNLYEGDTLITGTNSRTQIRFRDNALLALDGNSRIRIDHYHPQNPPAHTTTEAEPEVLMTLIEGGFRTLSGTLGKLDPSAYRVDTPVGSIGIRGTLYSATLQQQTLLAGAWQGSILIKTPFGEMLLGQEADFSFAEITPTGFNGLLEAPAALTPVVTTEAPAAKDTQSEVKDTQPASPPQESSQSTPEDSAGDNTSRPTAGTQTNNQTTDNRLEIPANAISDQDSGSVIPLPLEQNESSASLQTFADNGQLQETGDTTPTEVVRTSPDDRLSDAEYQELFNSRLLGAVISPSGVYIGTLIRIGDNEPLLVTGNSSADLTVIRFDGISEHRTSPIEGIEWGIWDGRDNNTIQLYPDWDSLAFSSLDEQALWLAGDPTRSIDLEALQGSVQFNTLDALGINNNGDYLNQANGSFTLDFDSGQIRNGQLQLQFDNDQSWDMQFDGTLHSGGFYSAIVEMDILSGSHGNSHLNLDNSEMAGLLIGEEAHGFVGGFNLHDQDGAQAAGVILMSQ
jgi:hypothetical protein